jgi:MFS family permease
MALMEDVLDGRPPSRRLRLSMAWAGLRERGRETGLLGNMAPAAERARAGSLLVLCAWSAFVVAGSSFAKITEHFGQAVPARAQALSNRSFDTVYVVAIIGGLLVLSGACAAVPAFLRFLRAGGWPSIRGHVLRAAMSTVAATVAMAGLVGLAHTLSPAQRNGGLVYHPVVWYYLLAIIPTALLVALALALWTVAAVAVTRRLVLARPVLFVITAATAVWWGAIASSAPWFLGAQSGSAASAFTPNLVGTMALMSVACAVATCGVVRVARSWRDLRLG